LHALVKYQRALETCILDGSAIKRIDEEYAKAEAEKTQRKSKSRKHV
jgi:hypothetical protein